MRYGSQRVAYPYFVVALLLFGLQMAFGLLSAAKYLGPDPLLHVVAFLDPAQRAGAVEAAVDLVPAVPAERARRLREHLGAVGPDQAVRHRGGPCIFRIVSAASSKCIASTESPLNSPPQYQP